MANFLRVIILLIAVFPKGRRSYRVPPPNKGPVYARSLHMSHYHNLNKVTDMQAVSRWIKNGYKSWSFRCLINPVPFPHWSTGQDQASRF